MGSSHSTRKKDNTSNKKSHNKNVQLCKDCRAYHLYSEEGRLSVYCPFYIGPVNVSANQEPSKNVDHHPYNRYAPTAPDEYLCLHNQVNNQLQSKSSCKPFDKEKLISKNQIIQLEEKKTAALPLTTFTKDNFSTMWFSQKNKLCKYLMSMKQTENDKEKWGIWLLNYLGTTGQEIYKTFNFANDQSKEDFDVLIEKFDQYCAFDNRKRKHNEDIDLYVNNLKIMASKYTTNVEKIVKEKILKEIDKEKFKNIVTDLSSELSVVSNLKSLSLQEVTYIWMKYENVNFKQTEKIDLPQTVRNCSKCALTHAINICPAKGKLCNKCGKADHYSSRCPSQVEENCTYCGESHFYRECPAYMNKCSRCDRVNHFYWMCEAKKMLNCNFCGLTHIASKSRCPAINTVCSKCYRRGHFAGKCRRKRKF